MAGVTRAYEYWPSSNRIKALHTSSLTGAIERSYTFDDEGRLTAETGPSAKTLTWDQKNRAKTTVAGSNSLSFAYDTANYRIGRSGGSLGSRDYYLEGEHLEAEYSGGAVQSQYFRGLTTDELVAGFSYDATGKWQPAIYHHDLLMSVTGISAHDGTAQQTASYSPFGDRLITATGASTNRLKYTGREQDSDTGLYYYRARYYDPAIGRFVSEDPLGFKGSGTNWYAYVANNPVNGNDPSGEIGEKIAVQALLDGAINIYLKVKSTWTSSQIAEAVMKTKALQGESQLIWTQPARTGEAARSWTAVGNTRVSGKDLDHIVDLQLGGADKLNNMQLLDASVNRSFGSQIYQQMKSYPYGTTIGGVTLLSSSGTVLANQNTGTVSATNVYAPEQWGNIGKNITSDGPNWLRKFGKVFDEYVNPVGIVSSAIQSYRAYQYYKDQENQGVSIMDGASGGFLLYPNKSNTNSAYSK